MARIASHHSVEAAVQPEIITVTISPHLQAFCATLVTWDGSRATPEHLLEDFLLCIEHQHRRPGSWEAALGREFLLSHGYRKEHL